MIFLLIATLIGWLCGAPVIGLLVGVAWVLLVVWADTPYKPRRRR